VGAVIVAQHITHVHPSELGRAVLCDCWGDAQAGHERLEIMACSRPEFLQNVSCEHPLPRVRSRL